MNNSKLIIGLIVFFFFGMIINAQDSQNVSKEGKKWKIEKKHKRLEKLSEELELDDNQKKEIKELYKIARESRKADRRSQRNNHSKLSEEERASYKVSMKQAINQLNSEIMTILNEEQRLKYENIIEEQEENMKEREIKIEKLRTYREENIKPVLLEQRLKLENEISLEDKALIADLRSRLNPRSLKRKIRKRNRGFKKHSKMTQEDREAIKSLVERYKKDIDVLHEEIADKKVEWESYMKSLRPKKVDDNRNERREKGKLKNSTRRFASFLLMDISS